ncbi:HAD family hydrolase [Candidatus Woesearchaeota archaeon]|nr:HAD family hydrolase [Candidatus Woesearchaeota archaeon]
MNKAVFLDRDGTINVDKGYVYKKEDLEFLPNAVNGLKNIQQLGFKLIIITNQSGIGKGYYSEKEYRIFMNELYKKLGEKGVKIEADYYCKHAPEKKCSCRKPNTKMIENAVKAHWIDKPNSYFIGDKTADILAGKNARLRTILVLTGKAGKDGKYQIKPDYICRNLKEASQIIEKS